MEYCVEYKEGDFLGYYDILQYNEDQRHEKIEASKNKIKNF